MVGAINAPATGNTFDAYLANAKKFSGQSGVSFRLLSLLCVADRNVEQQSVGFLVGEGASASTIPGPFSGSVTGFGVPTATAPASGAATASGSSSSSSAPASTSSSAAFGTKADGLVVVLAAMFGIALA